METRVFVLRGVPHSPDFLVTLLTAENTNHEIVIAAWSSAVRYSAKGYDVPDYDAAIKRMIDKHPSWQVLREPIVTIKYDPTKADDDI